MSRLLYNVSHQSSTRADSESHINAPSFVAFFTAVLLSLLILCQGSDNREPTRSPWSGPQCSRTQLTTADFADKCARNCMPLDFRYRVSLYIRYIGANCNHHYRCRYLLSTINPNLCIQYTSIHHLHIHYASIQARHCLCRLVLCIY